MDVAWRFAECSGLVISLFRSRRSSCAPTALETQASPNCRSLPSAVEIAASARPCQGGTSGAFCRLFVLESCPIVPFPANRDRGRGPLTTGPTHTDRTGVVRTTGSYPPRLVQGRRLASFLYAPYSARNGPRGDADSGLSPRKNR